MPYSFHPLHVYSAGIDQIVRAKASTMDLHHGGQVVSASNQEIGQPLDLEHGTHTRKIRGGYVEFDVVGDEITEGEFNDAVRRTTASIDLMGYKFIGTPRYFLYVDPDDDLHYWIGVADEWEGPLRASASVG